MKLRQIIINLVGNAVKFTDEGGIEVRVQLDGTREKEGLLIVEVEDTGKGVTNEELKRIFLEFEQGSEGARAGGTGLGLALSRQLTNLLGGEIKVESRRGFGSTFRVTVPVRLGPKAAAAVPVPTVTGLKPGQRAYSVLVVDDNPENRTFVSQLLSSIGFTVVEAVKGEEAVAFFTKSRPDIVLMDINMSGMDGYEATAGIRNAPGGASVPVIAVTANAFTTTKERIKEAGLNDLLMKPFSENEIFEILQRHLGVEYAFQTETPDGRATDGKAPSDDEVRRALAGLPEKTADTLLDAAGNLELSTLQSVIADIGSTEPVLAAFLGKLARNYRFEELTSIVQERRRHGT